MAYAAVISLKKTIKRVLCTSCVPIPSSIYCAYRNVCFFKRELERLDRLSSSREAFDALASQIREAAWKLEDVLELHELGLSNTKEVERKIRSFIEEANELVMGCSKIQVIDDHPNEASETLGTFFETFCIVGMAGIGKTTRALELFEDSRKQGDYNAHAFVTVGQKYELQDVLLAILSQFGYGDDLINVEDVEELGSCLFMNLLSNSFHIVLDDVWDIRVLKELSRFLPENNRRNRVMLTTRREVVAGSIQNSQNVWSIGFWSRERSWNLFCANVFQKGESCPHELVEVGRKIAEYCDGLPLAIITVAKLLAKAEKTVEYWLKVANEESTIFAEAAEKMSPVLLPSYSFLPMHLKQVFLYLGVFPCRRIIDDHKIIDLMEVEEFLEVQHPRMLFRNFAGDCLSELASENIVIENVLWETSRLHFAFWHLCVKEAERSKFYKVIKRRGDAFMVDIERERRLCIHNNVLFGIKDVYKSMSRISTARSVLCTGSYHQYPMSIDFDMRLLKVLDAASIRFADFPVQLLKLVQLRYLALTCTKNLPATISQLHNLQFLIVREHMWIRLVHVITFLPVQIWDMKELKCIDVMGAELPEPVEDDALLENLLILRGVSGHTCTQRVLQRIPNLKALGIFTELYPSGNSEVIGGFDYFRHLQKLEALACDVLRGRMITPKVVPWPILVSSFPSSIHAIKLYGQGYPWTMLANIAMLPCLEDLRIFYYACRGSKWSVSKDKGFVKLKTLSIEDTDLEQWEVEEGAFPNLEDLTVKHCYKLNQLPNTLACSNSITKITLIKCNPLIPKDWEYYNNNIAKINENEMANFSARANPIHIRRSFK